METLIQSVSAAVETTTADIPPQDNAAIKNSINIATGFVDSIINWVATHPRTAFVISVFLLGFIIGLLF
jgi:hypothetical protein